MTRFKKLKKPVNLVKLNVNRGDIDIGVGGDYNWVMNLYVYGLEADFTKAQRSSLDSNFGKVEFVKQASFDRLFQDPEPKVIALDPDITGWNISNEDIVKIPNLKAICLQTTGYEWVDGDFCRKHDIAVTNVPHYATISVAEKCIFMALALAKRYPLYLRNGGMSYAPEFIGDELYNKPTDIIGFGEIGHALAHRLDGLVGRKEICYYSHNQNDPEFHFWQFQDMLEKSEYMFITISKNPESLALFDDLSKFNHKMKVIIISNGFEEVTKRLVAKCEAGELGGVAFESDDPEILNYPYKSNIFVTPHNAHCTKEALLRLFEIWTDTIISVTDSQIINQVN